MSVLFIGVASAAPAAEQKSAHPDIDGIYVVSAQKHPLGTKLVDDALANPSVDGVYIVGPGWDEIEPESGKYDWSFFDKQLALVAAQHKKASIGFTVGRSTPDWVYAEGAKAFNTVVEIPRQPTFCDPMRLPIPWDPVYLRDLNKLITALGQRYANNPTVSLVKIIGIGYRTDETALPFERKRTVKSQYNGKTCDYPDDLAQWEEDGYTPARLAQAFRSIVSDYARAFPDLPLAMMTGTFPTIDQSGRADRRANAHAMADSANGELLAVGRQVAGERFVGQANTLKAAPAQPAIVAFGRTNPVGYQAAWYITNDPHCIMNREEAPCEGAEVMQRTLQAALAGSARYVELFPSDIENPAFQEALKTAHQQFQERARR